MMLMTMWQVLLKVMNPCHNLRGISASFCPLFLYVELFFATTITTTTVVKSSSTVAVKHQTTMLNKVSILLENIAEHLTAKKSSYFP